MTTLGLSIPKRLTIFMLALAALAAPASATVTYSYCTSGCNVNGSGDYTVWQTAPGSAGLTFSITPVTFATGGLSNGVFTDASGTVITDYNGATIDTGAGVNGSSLLQGANGAGTGFEITLPANTYGFAMNITSPNGLTIATGGLGNHSAYGSPYGITIPSTGSVQFFGILSDTPIASLFIASTYGGKLQINSFELGEAAPTPELSSLALIGSGLVLLAIRRRGIQKPDGCLA
jgi:hypothetical protein